ncbi:MAG TPA: zinc-ribbon domain-containing protein [Syntrophomonadaceae bacterium]|nr:zinc-ribbon domain-containing protein [Syntrophomonadaceae bacterium]
MYCPECGVQNPDVANYCSRCGCQLRSGAVAASEEKAVNYAGFWRRFVAYVIDIIVLSCGRWIIGFIIGFMIGIFLGGLGVDIGAIKATAEAFDSILGLVLPWLYFTLFESSSKQATLGKMAMGIVVTDLSRNRISFGRANARYWSKIISTVTLLVGYIMAGFTQKKQALHDIIAGTLVVQK